MRGEEKLDPAFCDNFAERLAKQRSLRGMKKCLRLVDEYEGKCPCEKRE